MKLENTSQYPGEIVRPLLRFALLGVNHGSMTVRLEDLKEPGCSGEGSFEWVPRAGRTPSEGHRLTLKLGGPGRFPTLLLGIAVRDWREALLVLAAYLGRPLWRRHRYGMAEHRHPSLPVTAWREGEGNAAEVERADCAAFARYRLRAYRELQRHERRWGWVPVDRSEAVLAASPVSRARKTPTEAGAPCPVAAATALGTAWHLPQSPEHSLL